MMRDVDRELELAGYDFMMFSTRRHVGKEASYVKTIASRMTDGLILITPLVPSEYLDALRERKFPYVLLDQGDKSGNSSIVESANRQGAYEATSYLIGLGHRRIAFITGLMEIESAVKRLAGYKAALAEHDIPFSEELVVSGDFSFTGGYKASQELLCLNTPPSAIFASNDFEALGAMESIRDKGLSIPDDISIIGFDDIRLASISFPKLSTVRQELSQMGKMAAQLLLEQIESPDLVPRRITMSTKLILRDSCAAIS
jgi:DNA-binding LacI/PurR family transcriptional regulator